MTNGQRRSKRRGKRAEISRRVLLKQAGVTLSTLAFGVACSGDDEGPSDPSTAGEGICGAAAGASSPMAGTNAGANAGTSGSGGASAGSSGTNAGTSGDPQAGSAGVPPSDGGESDGAPSTPD